MTTKFKQFLNDMIDESLTLEQAQRELESLFEEELTSDEIESLNQRILKEDFE